MNKLLWLPIIFLLAGLYFAGCKQSPLPNRAVEMEKPAIKAETLAPGADWEQKWESTVAEAKKEGKVTIYTLWNPDARIAVTKAFREKFGIEVEVIPFGRGAELLARVQAEKRAGLYLADVFGAGGPTLITTMKPAGVLGRIQPLLFLPEVIDPKMWKGGKLAFSDNEGHTIATLATAQRFFIYHKDLVKAGELTSYQDALKPQYKGKIALNDPQVTGSGNAFFSHLALNIWNVEEASRFLTQVVRDQKAEIIRDNRLQVEAVARGKHMIGLGARVATQAEFIALGAPVAPVLLNEIFVSHADSVLGVPTLSPHPSATLIFVNWLLSKEGHAVFVKSTGNPGLRIDAPMEGINPIFFPRPEEKIYLDSEEAILFRGKMLDVAKKVIAEAEKG